MNFLSPYLHCMLTCCLGKQWCCLLGFYLSCASTQTHNSSKHKYQQSFHGGTPFADPIIRIPTECNKRTALIITSFSQYTASNLEGGECERGKHGDRSDAAKWAYYPHVAAKIFINGPGFGISFAPDTGNNAQALSVHNPRFASE